MTLGQEMRWAYSMYHEQNKEHGKTFSNNNNMTLYKVP